MSNSRIAFQIAAGIAIACLMPVLILVLLNSLIPGIYPGIKLYIGLIALISLNLVVVSRYVRYLRPRRYENGESELPDSPHDSAKKHRPF